MQTFQDAVEMFATARNPERGKPLGPGKHTRLFKRGENYAVQLHDTDVVTYRPDGVIVLNDGGWQTVTTKERFNCYSPARISQEKGIWYLAYGIDPDEPEVERPWGRYPNYLTYRYQSGMEMRPDGTVWLGDSKCKVFNPIEAKRIEKFRRRVNKFAKDFIDRLYDGKIEAPGPGDCWYCYMQTDDGKSLGEVSRTPAKGDSTPGTDCANHIESHVKSRYFVPSLLYCALRWRSSQVMKWTVQALINGEDPPMGHASFVRGELVTMLRRYCYREMGMPC